MENGLALAYLYFDLHLNKIPEDAKNDILAKFLEMFSC